MKFIVLAAISLVCFAAFAAQANRPTIAKNKTEIAKLEKSQLAAKAAFKKAPKNNAAKSKYVDLSLQLAHDAMYLPEYSPKEKYPKALKLYREVLKVEPKNREAVQWKKTLEDIYRSMNRPIPPD
jgi:tetratricopeptide (TPR) repeat protein